MRIAVVGSGVSGLVCAHLLTRSHDVVLYERDTRLGGHAHTNHVELDGIPIDVDTGFLVYNERTYPLFSELLAQLRIATQPTDMSFSVTDEKDTLEWRASSPATVFAQRRNIVRAEFWNMLVDIARFNRVARRLLDHPPSDEVTLGDVLGTRRWSHGFFDWYLVPLGSSIWSADPTTFTEIPATTFTRFFDRHGWLRLGHQPSWRTITGGSKQYVDAIAQPLRDEGRVRTGSGVLTVSRNDGGGEVITADGNEAFDEVVIATHSDEALALLSDPSVAEREVLGSIRYQLNRATLHTDARLMPRRRQVWASWNYHCLTGSREQATLTYWLNQLQRLETSHQLFLTLNRDDEIASETVLARMDYAHPVFDTKAISAQARRGEVSGRRHTWFCGAYWGYGFHEDGIRSAIEVCAAFGEKL
jgi:predicted NAD/FAD-binding protein